MSGTLQTSSASRFGLPWHLCWSHPCYHGEGACKLQLVFAFIHPLGVLLKDKHISLLRENIMACSNVRVSCLFFGYYLD